MKKLIIIAIAAILAQSQITNAININQKSKDVPQAAELSINQKGAQPEYPIMCLADIYKLEGKGLIKNVHTIRDYQQVNDTLKSCKKGSGGAQEFGSIKTQNGTINIFSTILGTYIIYTNESFSQAVPEQCIIEKSNMTELRKFQENQLKEYEFRLATACKISRKNMSIDKDFKYNKEVLTPGEVLELLKTAQGNCVMLKTISERSKTTYIFYDDDSIYILVTWN